MEIKEYTKFRTDEILPLYTQVGWTAYTEDGKPSAQWEYMVLVTEDGAELISY